MKKTLALILALIMLFALAGCGSKKATTWEEQLGTQGKLRVAISPDYPPYESYDAQGNVVDTTKLTMSVNTVNISAQILNTKDVELEFTTTGDVAEGYEIGDITYSPQTVRIKGEAAVLNTINRITIPEEVLDMTGATSNIEKTVDISTYLPQGTSLVISSEAKIDVTVQVEAIRTKILQIPTDNIQVIGLDSDYKLIFDTDSVALTVTGRGSVLETLDENTITGTIDLTGVKTGAHNIPVQFEMDSDAYSNTETYAAVTVEEGRTQDAETDSAAGSNQSEEEQTAGRTARQ